MLLDSNIIIYSTRPEYPQLRQFLVQHAPVVSAVSYFDWISTLQILDPLVAK